MSFILSLNTEEWILRDTEMVECREFISEGRAERENDQPFKVWKNRREGTKETGMFTSGY